MTFGQALNIALARRQYSGNAKGVINGIGVVTCVYVNPDLDRFWVIDYRVYDPQTDGKSKLDHVKEMLSHSVYHKHLLFSTVLMDSWYAAKDLMLYKSIRTVRQTLLLPAEVESSGR